MRKHLIIFYVLINMNNVRFGLLSIKNYKYKMVMNRQNKERNNVYYDYYTLRT